MEFKFIPLYDIFPIGKSFAYYSCRIHPRSYLRGFLRHTRHKLSSFLVLSALFLVLVLQGNVLHYFFNARFNRYGWFGDLNCPVRIFKTVTCQDTNYSGFFSTGFL